MKKLFFLLPIACMAVLSCEKGMKQEVASFEFKGGEIVFRTAPETRATEITTADLTSFNVIATTGTTSQSKKWDDGVFSGTPGGSYTGGKYWPSAETTNDQWNFYASNAAMAYASTGCTIEVANCNTDVLACYLPNATYRASNALTFGHILCQVGTVTMMCPSGFTLSDLKVSILPIYSGTYDMYADSWTRGAPVSVSDAVYLVGSASAGVTPNQADGLTYVSPDNNLWLLPGSYQLTANYTIAKGDFSKSYSKHSTVTLQQGKNNNLGLPDSDNDGNYDDPNIPGPGTDLQEVTFTVIVTPWSNADVTAEFE